MRIATAGNIKWKRAVLAVPLFLFSVLYSLISVVHAAKIYPSAGSTSAAFLKIGAGARAVGMAGAYTSVADDPYAVYWNPAGLGNLGRRANLSFFHNDYFQGLRQEFLAYNVPAEKIKVLGSGRRTGVWGLGLDYFRVPKDMERRSGLNEGDPLSPLSLSEGDFGAYDLALSLGYGWRRPDGLALGWALKFIRQSIDDEAGSSLAADLGVLRDFIWRDEAFTAGFTVQNIGPGIKLVSRSYPLPLNFKAGLSRRTDGGVLMALDVNKPVDNYPFVALGAEYPVTDTLCLRSGYRYRIYDNELGAWSGFSAGMGLRFDRFSFDYAFTPFGELGNSHRFSISAKLGEIAPRAIRVPSRSKDKGSLVNARTVVYAVSPRPIMMSPRGTQYEIQAAAQGTELSSMTFRTMIRGRASAELSMAEGELPGDMPGDFPAGARPARAWQFAANPGNIQGSVTFGLKIKRPADAASVSFMYRTGKGWEQAKLEARGGDAEYEYFEATAPYSAYYVLVLEAGALLTDPGAPVSP